MDLIISFLIFIGTMVFCLVTGKTMVIALLAGLACFVVTGMRRGFSFGEVAKMCKDGTKDAVIVVIVMFIIGFVTGIWRSSGTISFFVYYGMEIITPKLFLVIAFLLCCIMSYALGTSFGVAGTVGVIFMALARSGGVNEVIAAGVIMSGIYFGDRNSPVSSSAVLVAGITRTNIIDNVKLMLKDGLPAFLTTLAFYCMLSVQNPITQVDDSFKQTLTGEFSISPWCVLPAMMILILPMVKVSVINSLIASIVAGAGVSVLVQKESVKDVILTMIRGYEIDGPLGEIMNGGGLVSMIEVVFIVAISCMYSGIFSGTEILAPLQEKVTSMANKTGRFFVTTILSILTLGVFCNQTIASMMTCDIVKKTYRDGGASDSELAIDLEDSVIVIAGLVPWTIACTVPMEFLQVGYGMLPYAMLLYMLPICRGVRKRFFGRKIG